MVVCDSQKNELFVLTELLTIVSWCSCLLYLRYLVWHLTCWGKIKIRKIIRSGLPGHIWPFWTSSKIILKNATRKHWTLRKVSWRLINTQKLSWIQKRRARVLLVCRGYQADRKLASSFATSKCLADFIARALAPANTWKISSRINLTNR